MAPMRRPATGSHRDYAGTLSLGNVARQLHITKKQVRRLLGNGEMDFVQLRGSIRIPQREVQDYTLRCSAGQV